MSVKIGDKIEAQGPTGWGAHLSGRQLYYLGKGGHLGGSGRKSK